MVREVPVVGPWSRLTRPRRRLLLALLVLSTAGLVAFGVHHWPQRDLESARAALRRHEHAAARASLLRYLEANPKSAEAHLLLAQLDRRANQYADAARHLTECQRLGGPPDAIRLERALGAIQNGVYNSELDRLCQEHLARRDVDPYLIWEALSQGFTRTYRLNEALACLNQMLVLQPDSSYVLRRRAWICSQAEDYERAEADYRRALEIDPADAVARLGLAEILLNIRKNGAEAGEHYERLWSVQRDSTVLLGLARSWQLVGRGEETRQLLDDWLAGHPGDVFVLAERGRLAWDEQDVEKAVTLLRRAVQLAPYMIDANYTLSLCLSQQGRTAEAEECEARIREAKESKKQMGLLMQRLQSAPEDADLRCQIAQQFLRYGAEEEGARWLLTTLENHPHHAPSHLALADYYDKQGQPGRAADHRRLAGKSEK
jgi:tetratricopeptide (TPR) repeat protein